MGSQSSQLPADLCTHLRERSTPSLTVLSSVLLHLSHILHCLTVLSSLVTEGIQKYGGRKCMDRPGEACADQSYTHMDRISL